MAQLFGTAGPDTITPFFASVGVTGGTSTSDPDLLVGFAGDDSLDGGGGDDFIIGGAGADIIIGGDGVDTAVYSNAPSGVGVDLRLTTGQAGPGDQAGDLLISIENLTGSNFADVLIGNAGNNGLTGNDGNDTLLGFEGDDNLTGGAGNDSLDGADGNDVLIGGPGADNLNGGAGTDTVAYFNSSAAVLVQLLLTTAQTGGDAQGDILTSIENVVGSSFNDTIAGTDAANSLLGDAGDDYLTALGGNDTLTGFDGTDTLVGGDGNDFLSGGAGADSIDGGVGTDTASYASATVGVYASFVTPGSNTGDAAGDVYVSVENLDGSDLADVLIGNALPNVLTGNNGDDQLVGGGGGDTLIGGLGDDFYYVITTGDLVIEGPNGGLDRVFSTIDYTLPANVEVLFLQGNALNGSGNVLDNTIVGNGFSNLIQGFDGSDYLVDGGGADTLIGGVGDDYYFVSTNAGVSLVEDPNGGFDRLFATASVQLADNVEALILQGTGNIDGTGNNAANGIIGNDANNVLWGRGGNDLIYGKGGDDIFVFRAGDGQDIMADFQGAGLPGGDVLYLDSTLAPNLASLIALASQNGPDATFNFGNGNVLTLFNVIAAGMIQSDVVFI